MFRLVMEEQEKKMYSYALGLLSRRDISERMLFQKIQKKFQYANNEHIDSVVGMLKTQKFVNDTRFIENFIRWRCETMPRGKQLILQELLQKKVDPDLAQSVLEEEVSEEKEKEMCQVVAQQKQSILSHDLESIKKREKLMRFLLGKGFLYHTVYDVVNNILN